MKKRWILLIILALLIISSLNDDFGDFMTNIGDIIYWISIHILLGLAVTIGAISIIIDLNHSDDDGIPSGVILGIAFVVFYIFHFFHLENQSFNYFYFTQMILLIGVFYFYRLFLFRKLYGHRVPESISYALVSSGIVCISFLVNIKTGKYLEPFVFSCAGMLSIIITNIFTRLREASWIDTFSPILCLGIMIYGVLKVDIPNYFDINYFILDIPCYLYFISIQCGIATLIINIFSFIQKTIISFFYMLINYIWVFIIIKRYIPNKFTESFLFSLIGWGTIIVLPF